MGEHDVAFDVAFASIAGFHVALVVYYLLKLSTDVLLHSLIFLSGATGALIFAVSKRTFESRAFFIVTMFMVFTTFVSSLVLSEVFPAASSVLKWLVTTLYNIASARTMKLVRVDKVAKRNIMINALTLALNVLYSFY